MSRGKRRARRHSRADDHAGQRILTEARQTPRECGVGFYECHLNPLNQFQPFLLRPWHRMPYLSKFVLVHISFI